jgi:predicted transcriptional regulator
MAARKTPTDINQLAGYVPKPVVQDKVRAAIATLEFPFLLTELVELTGLPRHTVNKVLDRLIKKGLLTRRKVPIVRAGIAGRIRVQHPVERPTYLYRVAGKA